MNIWIDQETQKEVNIHAPYKGRSKLDTAEIRAEVGVIEYTITTKPLDYSDETYTCDSTGDGMPPYRLWTKKKPEQLLEIATRKFENALDSHLDSVAREYRYNDRFTFALRAGYTGPFQAEGQAFATWMDSCNAQAYQKLQEVLAGTSQMPATPAEFIETLPVFVWPPVEPDPVVPDA